MYLDSNTHPAYSEEVLSIQQSLNRARATLSEDVVRKYGWPRIAEDGFYWEESAKAVTAFQQFMKLSPPSYGILGKTTINALNEYIESKSTKNLLGGNCVLRSSGPILRNNGAIITNGHPKTEIDVINKSSSFDNTQKLFLSADFKIWKDSTGLVGSIITLMNNGMIAASMILSSLDTIHFNWTKFWTDFICDSVGITSPTRKETLVWRNKGNTPVRSRGTFTAYRFSKLNKYAPLIDKIRSNVNLSPKASKLGYISLGFEYLDSAQAVVKTFKGEMKIIDLAGSIGNTVKDTILTIAEPLHDALIGTSSVEQKLPVKKVTQNLGKTIAKTKFATKIASYGAKAGATATGVGTTSAFAIVGIQCVGAFLMGWEIGKWIEAKTHWGEKSIDWLLGQFLGDWVTQFYEWKINRVIVIQYPSNWTEQQIQEFKASIEHK